MDGQMRLAALVVGLLFLVGTATLVVSSNLFNYTPFEAATDFELATEETGPGNLRRPQYRGTRLQRPDTDVSLLSVRSEVSRLERQLKDRTAQLDERNRRIDQLNSQLRQLRAAPRETPVPQSRTASRADPPPATAEAPELRREIDRLNQSLLDADVQEADYQEQLTRLRDSLDRANDELDLLEDGANAQLNSATLKQRRRQGIIGDLVARFGPDSVPLLVDLLEEDDPQLRIWALQVLGQLGDDGEEAIEDISPLFEDPSADVRDAARQAVDSIRGR